MDVSFQVIQLKDTVSQWFKEHDKDLCSSEISSLPTKWRKCIKLKRDYDEKQSKHIFSTSTTLWLCIPQSSK